MSDMSDKKLASWVIVNYDEVYEYNCNFMSFISFHVTLNSLSCDVLK